MTEIVFWGHACLSITASNGEVLLLDPYEPGGFGGQMRYRPPSVSPTVVTTTHDHADHAHVGPFRCDHVVDGDHGPFQITRFPAWHDEYEGERFGGSVDRVLVEVDGYRLLHLSDIGAAPEPGFDPGPIDVLFVPIGGFYTIGAAQALAWISRIRPRCFCPIHFRTAACDLPIVDDTFFRSLVLEATTLKTLELGESGVIPTGCVFLSPKGLPSQDFA